MGTEEYWNKKMEQTDSDKLEPYDIYMKGINSFENEELIDCAERYMNRGTYTQLNRMIVGTVEDELGIQGPKKKWWEDKFKERIEQIKEVMNNARTQESSD